VPVYEEQLRVGKRDVSHGRVRIGSYVVETPVNEQVRLHSESVQVERKLVDRPVAAGDALFHDRVIEAEERAEEAVGGCGFTMYEAGNAYEAIPLLELHDDIRAVFTDINMPGSMDGLKLAHYVRGRWPPIKLIITSGQRRPLADDMPAGSAFVAKPYQLEKVAADLRAMIG